MTRATRRSSTGPLMALALYGKGRTERNAKVLATDENHNGVKVDNKDVPSTPMAPIYAPKARGRSIISKTIQKAARNKKMTAARKIETQPGDGVDNAVEAPKKRGRGNWRRTKNVVAVDNVDNAVEAPKKRGRGNWRRTKNVVAVDNVDNAVEAPKKRGRGNWRRTKKNVGTVAKNVLVRKAPGRKPKKNQMAPQIDNNAINDDNAMDDNDIYRIIMDNATGITSNQKHELVKKYKELVTAAAEKAHVNSAMNIRTANQAIEMIKHKGAYRLVRNDEYKSKMDRLKDFERRQAANDDADVAEPHETVSNGLRGPTSTLALQNRRPITAPVASATNQISMGSAQDLLGLGPQMAGCRAKVEIKNRMVEKPGAGGRSVLCGQQLRLETVEIKPDTDPAYIAQLRSQGYTYTTETFGVEDGDRHNNESTYEEDGQPIIEEVE